MKKKIAVLSVFFFLLSGLHYAQSIPNAIPKAKDKTNIDETLSSQGEKPKAEAGKAKTQEKAEPEKEKPQAEETKTKEEPKKEEITVPVLPKKEEPVKETEKKEKKVQINYTDKGVVEIGGIIWGEFRAFKGGSIEQQLWGNAFFSVFLTNYFLMGLKGDGQYNLDTKQYLSSGYLVAGAAFPLTDSFFMNLNVNIGYAYSNMSPASSSLFSYGNEIGFKIKLKDHFLLGISAVYSFYTDFSQDFFNDKIRASIAFSGYF